MTTNDIDNFKDKVIEVIKDWFVNSGFKDRKLTDTPTDMLQVANKAYADGILPTPGASGNVLTSDGTIWTSATSPTTTGKTFILLPNFTTNGIATAGGAGIRANDLIFWTGQIIVPDKIIINNLSIYVGTVTSSGIVKVGIYSEDGQTRYISVSDSISGSGVHTFTVSPPVTLTAGVYFIGLVVTSGTNVDIATYVTNITNGVQNLRGGVSGKSVIEGTMAISSGVLPTTFNPTSDISVNTGATEVIRLDN